MAYVFISGATGGIGKAFVYACAKRGDNLYLTGRSQEKLLALKEEVGKIYPIEIEIFACDLTCENSRNLMIDDISAKGIKFGSIINVAGVDIQKGFLEKFKRKSGFICFRDCFCFGVKKPIASEERMLINQLSGHNCNNIVLVKCDDISH